MNIREVIVTINQMQADSVIEHYAIGGAVGATFYLEPVATLDVDIFVTFRPEPGSFSSAHRPFLIISKPAAARRMESRSSSADGRFKSCRRQGQLWKSRCARLSPGTWMAHLREFSPPNTLPPSLFRPDAARTSRDCYSSLSQACSTPYAFRPYSPATDWLKHGGNLTVSS